MSLKSMAAETNAEPFGPANTYGGASDTTTWDEEKIQGCVCDSAWNVGFKSGETQSTQWFGADCSRKRCPSGDDPRTTDIDETDCSNFADNGKTWCGDIGSDGNRYAKGATLPAGVTRATVSTSVLGENCGEPGNKCYVECSNRGLCNYATGQCTCFQGYFGANCGLKLRQPG